MPAERKPGIGLALSGGGFRATLFHLGALWRLNELGRLGRLAEVTSVSGGSIAAGVLAHAWPRLRFDADGVAVEFRERVVDPLREFCLRTIDVGSILGGLLSPVRHPSELIAAAYDKRLFRGARLADLPDPERAPVFTIYATSLQTGRSVRFTRGTITDYLVGRARVPDLSLARAVAASTAFPPPLCPLRIDLDPAAWERLEGATLYEREALRSRMMLGDGGIYDNLGLQRVAERYETVLVSDAGAPLVPYERSWAVRISQLARTLRALEIIAEQTRALRKRALVRDLERGEMHGAYWGIATEIGNYRLEQQGLAPPLCRDGEITRSLASLRTRLSRFSPLEQERLINWGYALTDAAMRRHVLPREAPPGALPFPGQPL